jgi:hypothetical protein
MACGVERLETWSLPFPTRSSQRQRRFRRRKRPEFVDIDERTYNMDVQKLRGYLETQCTPFQIGQADQQAEAAGR